MFGENLSNVKYIPLYSIFLLLMTICGYNLSEILPSQYRKDIKKVIFARYIFLFFTIFFLIISISTVDILKNLLQTLIIFVWFCILIRNIYPLFIFNLFLLFFIYILSIQELDDNEKSKDTKILKFLNNFFTILCFCLTIIGFMINFIKTKKKFKKKFELKTFLFGNQNR